MACVEKKRGVMESFTYLCPAFLRPDDQVIKMDVKYVDVTLSATYPLEYLSSDIAYGSY